MTFMTEPYIYNYSLCIALPLMLFIGFYFIFAKVPAKAIYDNYLWSRRIMGIAILLLSINYMAHFFFRIRFSNSDAAILLNLSTYFLCYWLFCTALNILLENRSLTQKKIWANLGSWLIFSALACIILFFIPKGSIELTALYILSGMLLVYGLILARGLLRAYHKAISTFEETQADDIGNYIHWLSTFTYWAIIFGIGCSLLTFLPDKYVPIWILSSIPFYIYLFCCYQNYLLFYEQVERAISSEELNVESSSYDTDDKPAYHNELTRRISEWVDTDGYLRSGLTIKELAETLLSNRTYLSEYIKTTYGVSFCDWITGLRIEYAKSLMVQNPKLIVSDIAEKSGFLSSSHFIRLFKEKTGQTPARWRKQNSKIA